MSSLQKCLEDDGSIIFCNGRFKHVECEELGVPADGLTEKALNVKLNVLTPGRQVKFFPPNEFII